MSFHLAVFSVSWVIQEASATSNALCADEVLCPCPSGSEKMSGGVHFLVAECGITVNKRRGRIRYVLIYFILGCLTYSIPHLWVWIVIWVARIFPTPTFF